MSCIRMLGLIIFVLAIVVSLYSIQSYAEYASIAPCTPENYIAPKTDYEIRELKINLAEDTKVASVNRGLLLTLLCRAAAAGIERAEFSLGLLLSQGEGLMKKDEKQARYWLKRSADKGNLNSKFLLSVLYREALGGPPLAQSGMKLLREAAEGGYDQAMLEMATEYVYGRYVTRDLGMARSWANRAMQAGHPSAGELIQDIDNAPSTMR